jgi:hypothetical protein
VTETEVFATFQLIDLRVKLLASLRVYTSLLERRPNTTTPSLFLDEGRRRIVCQVWDRGR